MNQKLNINVAELPDIVCDNCQNNIFTMTYVIKKVSSFYSPTGKQEPLPINGPFICLNCGQPLNLNNIQNEKEEKNESKLIIPGK